MHSSEIIGTGKVSLLIITIYGLERILIGTGKVAA